MIQARVVAAVVLGLLAAMLLSGCPNNSGGTDADGRVTLRWLTDNNPLRRQQVDLFESMYPDIRIDLDVSKHGLDKILTQIAAGTGPDLTDIENMGAFRTLARNGALVDLTEMVAQNESIDMSRYFDAGREWMEVDDKVYALTHGCIAISIICNVKMFRDAGVPLPEPGWTWDDFRETAAALTKKNDRGRVEQFGWAGYLDWAWYHWLWQNGADVFNEDLTRCTLDSPEAKETMRFIYDLREKHHVFPNESDVAAMSGGGGWGSGGVNLFAVDKVAMLERGRDVLIVFRNEPQVEWTAVPLPQRKSAASTYVSRGIGITRDCRNVEAAFKFLEFVHSDEYQRQIVTLADGQPSRRDICESEAFLQDPDFPKERVANRVFLEQMDVARNPRMSPWITFPQMDRIITEEFDRMWAGLSDPEETCDRMARRINAEIEKNRAG